LRQKSLTILPSPARTDYHLASNDWRCPHRFCHTGPSPKGL